MEKVEAFLFNGELIKNQEWVVPDWVKEAFGTGALSYSYRGGYGLVADLSSDRSTRDLEDFSNLILHEAWVKTDSGKGRVSSDMTVSPIYIVQDYMGRIFLYSKEDFESKFDRIEEGIELVRVDILPKRYKDDLFPLKGEWVYVPPEPRSLYYTIRCSTCGKGFKVENTQNNLFTQIIAPRHFCSNCGSEMQNSDLPKREG